jgi:tol-pal system protein YbgF
MSRARCHLCRTTGLQFGAALALLFAAPSPPAGAELPALAGEIAALRLQLAGLQRVEPAQAIAQQTDSGRLAQYEVRLGQIEEELRRLTGRVEQLEHDQRTLEGRFDQLIGDLDQRLRSVEQGTPAGAPLAAVAPEPGPGQARPPGQTSAPPAGNLGAPPQDLGQIPQSAITTLPRTTPPAVAPPPPAVAPSPATAALPPQQQYDAAMEMLRAGDYAGAETALQQFLEQHPEHQLDSNAAYWLAETYYVRRNYAAAAAAFARNYRTYGKSAAKAPDNLLKLGMSLEGLGEKEKACLSYNELSKEFPDAPAHIQEAVARERARAECA